MDEREHEERPVVGEDDGGDLTEASDGPPTEDRPRHVRPESEQQQSTEFIDAPDGGG